MKTALLWLTIFSGLFETMLAFDGLLTPPVRPPILTPFWESVIIMGLAGVSFTTAVRIAIHGSRKGS